MNEDLAKGWLAERFGDDAVNRLARFVDMVVAENNAQNLIAPSTIEVIWARHVLDSAQLVALAPAGGTWLDIGTGGGFPGMVVAILRPAPMILVEPRRRRAAFLNRCANELGIYMYVNVVAANVETLAMEVDVISARAVASVEKLLHGASRCAMATTRWLLPRGVFAASDLDGVRQRWGGVFHVEQSLSNPESSILVADGVYAR